MNKIVTLQNAAAANGSGTPLILAERMEEIGVEVSGTFEATVHFEGRVGSDWFPVTAVRAGRGGERSRSTIEAGSYTIDVAGMDSLRARVADYVSGSVTVRAAKPFSATRQTTEVVNVLASGSHSDKLSTLSAEKLAIYVGGLPASSTVEVFLLDETGARLGAAWQTITASGFFLYEVGWPDVEILVTNGSAAAANVTLSYAVR